MRYDLVIFDFDGTLADSSRWMMDILNVMARRHRFRQVDRAGIERLRGLPTREVMRALDVRPWRLPFIAADMRRLSAADAAAIPVFPNAIAALRELADSGAVLAIVSSNGSATVRAVLGDAQHLIDIYACEASLFGKARKIARLARQLAIPSERVLYVGDETRDVEAAFKAGVASAAVAWGYNHPDALRAARPTHLVARFDDLVELVLDRRPMLKLVF